jgi:glycosyltransferase involved in cell wall biosynthesis
MKIQLVFQYYLSNNEPGGSRWSQLTRYFARNPGHRVDVLAGNIHYSTGHPLPGSRLYSRESLQENLTIHRTWTSSGYNANFMGRLLSYLSYMVSASIGGLFLPRPDLIVCSSPPIFAGVPALLLSWIRRVPLVFEVRDLWPDSAVATGVLSNRTLLDILYRLERMLYRRASLIIALTPAFEVDIARRFPAFASKIHVISNAADFNLMPDSPRGEEIRRDRNWQSKKVFGYFGAHGVANDLDQLLEAAKLLKARPSGQSVRIVLVGDGMKKASLIERARAEGLDNVEFVDSQPKTEVFHWMDACDVCVATLKKTDVFRTVYPNKVFDYMAAGKPVLVTIDGITRDLLQAANCGRYSEPENAEALAATIEEMAKLPSDTLAAMGRSGFDHVTVNFDRMKLAERYEALLLELAGRKP